jgi:hypothetical protein
VHDKIDAPKAAARISKPLRDDTVKIPDFFAVTFSESADNLFVIDNQGDIRDIALVDGPGMRYIIDFISLHLQYVTEIFTSSLGQESNHV